MLPMQKSHPAVRAALCGSALLVGGVGDDVLFFRIRVTGILRAELAVRATVEEVDDEADEQPDEQPDPSLTTELDHQKDVGSHSQDGHQGNQGALESGRQIPHRLAEEVD